MKVIYIISFLLGSTIVFGGWFSKKKKKQEFVCFYMLNSEIKHSLEENERQKDMLKNGALMEGFENINNGEFREINEVSKTIKNRLGVVSVLLQTAPFAVNIVNYISETYKMQEKIIRELSDAPLYIVVALPSELKFAKHLEQNMLFVIGVVASYGAINEMESKDRRVLLKFAESEFKALYYESWNIYSQIINARRSLEWKVKSFQISVNMDQELFNDIVTQF